MLAAALACTLVFGAAPSAEAAEDSDAHAEKMLVPVGRTVGIKLFADGVMVVALGEQSAAKQAGLRDGDVITAVDDVEVTSAEQFIEKISDSGGEEIVMTYMRDGREYSVAVTPSEASDGGGKIGAWIRDSMAGIGTVTFLNPETGVFGALGHGINDVDTGVLMPMERGSVMRSVVAAVNRGDKGAPGELRGEFDLTNDLGSLYANTGVGVFGVAYDKSEWQGTALPAGSVEDVRTGEAEIMANVAGGEVCRYDVEILRVDTETDSNRNLMIKVTDERLLAATGGIVQGMSGSPIIQDGRLIGAVTHVLVNDPQLGYGITIDRMLSAADTASEPAA